MPASPQSKHIHPEGNNGVSLFGSSAAESVKSYASACACCPGGASRQETQTPRSASPVCLPSGQERRGGPGLLEVYHLPTVSPLSSGWGWPALPCSYLGEGFALYWGPPILGGHLLPRVPEMGVLKETYLPFRRSAPSTLGWGQAICFLGITRRPRRPHRGRLNPADGRSVARDLALRPWPLEAHFLFCAPESLLLGGTGGPSRTQNAVPKSSPFPWREAPGSGGPQSPGQPNSGAPRSPSLTTSFSSLPVNH